jgi:hypothetical protein
MLSRWLLLCIRMTSLMPLAMIIMEMAREAIPMALRSVSAHARCSAVLTEHFATRLARLAA